VARAIELPRLARRRHYRARPPGGHTSSDRLVAVGPSTDDWPEISGGGSRALPWRS
jgi:hypothetical protein